MNETVGAPRQTYHVRLLTSRMLFLGGSNEVAIRDWGLGS